MKIKAKKESIQIEMIKKGFNQKSLSKAIGIHQSVVSNFLSGRSAISAINAKKMLLILGEEFDDLFYIEKNNLEEVK